MKILQKLNNNAVISRDKEKREIIVTGRGIAFGAKLGAEIDESKIQKIFILQSSEIQSAFLQLLQNTPVEYIELAEEIIDHARMTLNKKLNDSIYITLVDHIYSSVERYRENIMPNNALKWEICQFYPDEFRVGQYALEKIEEKYEIHMEEDEAAFIALHIVTAEIDDTISKVYEMTAFMKEIIDQVESYFSLSINQHSLSYFRFITHLKFFSQRLFNHQPYYDGKDLDLYALIKKRYPKEFDCVQNIKAFLRQEHEHTMTMDESIYLTIHVAKVIRETKSEKT